MSGLLGMPPYGTRDDVRLLAELNELTAHHVAGCLAYSRVWPQRPPADTFSELPFLHVGLFKQIELKTVAPGITHERVLNSSSTRGASPSRIPLDSRSSHLQAESSASILRDFIGPEPRPLVVIDSASSLRQRGGITARTAAAMSLKPFATRMIFALDDPGDPASLDWDEVAGVLETSREILVYGFTSALWLAWASRTKPARVRELLAGCRVHFVHSGGWKKLEEQRVDRVQFDSALLESLDPASRVVDFYGLVEQTGVIYPLCEHGYRHAPVWANVLCRDAFTLECVTGRPGMLQLMNVTAWGAPYHNVLTEDVGVIVDGPCACGRCGPRFELMGRIPNAELRGCANA